MNDLCIYNEGDNLWSNGHLARPVGGINCMDKTTPVVLILINCWKSDQISLETCVQEPVSSNIDQIWTNHYTVSKSRATYSCRIWINCLSEGEVTSPLPLFKIIYVARGTSHRCDSTPHCLEPKCRPKCRNVQKLRKRPMTCATYTFLMRFLILFFSFCVD